jgi:murein DD-endopeptidase MepM/ murein hydrolase activator NlpD
MNSEPDGLTEASRSKPKWKLKSIWISIEEKIKAIAWRWQDDRQAFSAFLGRYGAHVSIFTLVLLVGIVQHASLAPLTFAESSPGSEQSSQPIFLLPQTTVESSTPITQETSVQNVFAEYQQPRVVIRQAQPRTLIPDRIRLEVITYTVKSGDNIFLIAEKFNLSAYTIAWSNMEILQGAPWMIQPGITLYIPPVEGAYHTVMEGETPESIAESYEVELASLFNIWNPISEGDTLSEGMLLVVPGGIGDDIEWEPPPPPPSQPAVGVSSGSWGYCGDTAVSGYGANGYFILPTGSYSVSGWTFHDPRNPMHGGLDYRCRLGDPIYAADAGVVIFAGWSGGYGNLVRVSHGNGYQTYYAHFNAFAVSCGEPVAQGQIIGYCGTTGWSSGPHLHYEIRLNGVQQNPALFEP